jgi:hypothetical protein
MNCLRDRLKYSIDLVVDLSIAKAEDDDADRFDVGLAGGIVGLGFGAVVGGAVEFDREFEFGGVEVDHESIDAILSAEFAVFEAALAQMGPEVPLGGGHVVTEVAAQWGEFGTVEEFGHGANPVSVCLLCPIDRSVWL